MELDKLDNIYNLLNLINLIETCCTKYHKYTTDLFMTKRPLSFQNVRATRTYINDSHKPSTSIFYKSCYTHLKPKIVYYRNYKFFFKARKIFIRDLEKSNFAIPLRFNTFWNIKHFLPKYVNLSAPVVKRIRNTSKLFSFVKNTRRFHENVTCRPLEKGNDIRTCFQEGIFFENTIKFCIENEYTFWLKKAIFKKGRKMELFND